MVWTSRVVDCIVCFKCSPGLHFQVLKRLAAADLRQATHHRIYYSWPSIKMQPIPTPRGWPLIGNVLDLSFDNPNASLAQLAQTYGRSVCLAPNRHDTHISAQVRSSNCTCQTSRSSFRAMHLQRTALTRKSSKIRSRGRLKRSASWLATACLQRTQMSTTGSWHIAC